MTAGPGSPGTGPRRYQPAVTASFGTSRAPVRVRPRSTRPVVCTPIAGTSRATGFRRSARRTVAEPASPAASACVVGGALHATTPASSPASSRAGSAVRAPARRTLRSAIRRVTPGLHTPDRLHLHLLAGRAEAVLAGDAVLVGVELVRVALVGVQRGLRIGLVREAAAVAVVGTRRRPAAAGVPGGVGPRGIARDRRRRGGRRGRGRVGR